MNYTDSLKPAMDLIYLVSCAVNNEKPDKRTVEGFDLPEVLKTAHCHSLSAAAAFALEKIMALPEDFKEAKYKAVRRQSLLNFERERVIAVLEDNGIWYIPLKGVKLKDLYPKSSMREMSDNDILCDGEKMAEIKTLMEGLGFVCTHFEKNHHDVYEKPPKLCFEMHRNFFNKGDYPDQYEYFEKIKDKKIKDSDNQYGYHLSNEDFYIYLINHLYIHYRTTGTGLRSLLDIYVFYNKFKDMLDMTYINRELEKLGLVEFERGMRELSVKTFTRQKLTETELDELGYFIAAGTQGSMENLMMQQLDNDDSQKAKKRYILNRIFPSDEHFKRNHPVVFRHKILYPFWVVYRPVKAAVTHPKRIIKEVKRLKDFKKKENRGTYNR